MAWRVDGPDFAVTCFAPTENQDQWFLHVATGSILEGHTDSQGDDLADWSFERQAIGSSFSEVAAVLDFIPAAHQIDVWAALESAIDQAVRLGESVERPESES